MAQGVGRLCHPFGRLAAFVAACLGITRSSLDRGFPPAIAECYSANKMRTQTIGQSDLVATRLAYGCWRLAGSEGGPRLEASVGKDAVFAAFEAGYTFFDHADIYGRGECERIFGQVLKDAPEMRDRIVLASKCGIRPPWDGAQQCYDSSPEHILTSVDQSLQRLGVDHLDLLMIHRPDYLGDPHEIAATFAKLRAAGKVRWFGASNFRPSQVAALQAACDFPLVAHQVEVSLATRITLDDGTLDQCLASRMTPLAWSPLDKGNLIGLPRSEREENLQTHMDVLAVKHHTTRAAIALAWLLRHPSRMIPIIGSLNPRRIREAAHADAVELSREEWYSLLIAIQGVRLP
jgi:predicted oxidoreductase